MFFLLTVYLFVSEPCKIKPFLFCPATVPAFAPAEGPLFEPIKVNRNQRDEMKAALEMPTLQDTPEFHKNVTLIHSSTLQT